MVIGSNCYLFKIICSNIFLPFIKMSNRNNRKESNKGPSGKEQSSKGIKG